MKNKTRHLLVVLLFFAVTLVFLFGNAVVRKGSVMENAILNKDDAYYKMDIHVKELKKDGLNASEFIPIIMKFPDGIKDRNDLGTILRFDKKLKEAFPDLGVMSLVDAVDYHDTGEELANPKFISRDMLDDQNLNIESWKHSVRKNSGVYGKLVGKEFEYAVFAIYLPQGYDEIPTYRRVTEFIEQRHINLLQWYTKTDIEPFFENVMVAGWVVARGLVDASINVDVLMLSTLGIILASAIFYLSIGSIRQAVMTALGVVLLSIVWVRGSIGLLDIMGIPIRERVFSIIGYTNCIVQGISFGLHCFGSFNQIRAQNKEMPPDIVWQRVAESVHPLINITALLSFLGFATLYWFEVLSIRELGITSALGAVYLLLLSKYFIPSLHILIGGYEKNKHLSLFNMMNALTTNTATSALSFLSRFSEPRRIIIALAILLVLPSLAAVLFIEGHMEVNSKPIDYLKGTLIEKTANYVNTDGRIGFDCFEMLIEPSDGGDIYDPEFIDESYRFVSSLTGFPKVRELVTVLDTVALISRESYKKGLATERQELKDIFFLIESDLNPRVKEQFWFQKGIRVSITTATNYSKEMQTLSDAILEKSAQFKGLKASFFGTTALYPRFDEYVRDGKPWNVMSSQWLIVVVCAIWIFFRSYGNRNNTPYVMYGVRSGLVMSVPFVFATSLMALVMMAFNIPLDIATATISALAINASIDFSIYFMAEYSHLVLAGKNRQEALSDSLSNEGRLVVEDSLLNITCFLPLLLSSFPPVAKIGWIMGVMLVACCIGTILLMPALLPICVGERRSRRESELRRFAARALPVYQRDRGEM